jgi:hypothetical protein
MAGRSTGVRGWPPAPAVGGAKFANALLGAKDDIVLPTVSDGPAELTGIGGFPDLPGWL